MFEVPSKWFVIYEEDPTIDPLSRGVEDFQYGTDASEFKKRMENKGYKCTVFLGEVSGMFHPDIGRHGDNCTCQRCVTT